MLCFAISLSIFFFGFANAGFRRRLRQLGDIPLVVERKVFDANSIS